MVAPAVLVVAGVLLFPLAFSLWTSLNDVSTVNLSMKFVGLRNYSDAVHTPFFVNSLTNTLFFATITIIGTTILGLAFALVLNERFIGRGLLRALIILPWALSQVVVGIIWSWIYNGTFGVLNAMLQGVGLIHDYQGWLSNPSLALTFVAVAFVWSSVPFAVVMYLGTLQTISADLYKAARVDGAHTVQRFRYITLPALRYTTLVILLVASLDGLLAFSLIYIMTGGGPGVATTVLAWLGYETTFANLNLGMGAAIFYMLVVFMIGVAFWYVRVLHRPGDATR
jgi:multiple sugar transport system permease protein